MTRSPAATTTRTRRTAPPTVGGRRRTVGLALLLSVSIGGLVLVATFGVLTVIYETARRATIETYSRHADVFGVLAAQRVRAYLDPVREELGFIAELIRTGEIDPDDRTGLSNVLKGAIVATPQIFALLFWDTELRFTGEARFEDQVVAVQQSAADRGAMAAALSEAAGRSQAYWTDVGFIRKQGTGAVNVRQPIVGPDGAFRGVLQASITIESLSRLMEGITGMSGIAAMRGTTFMLYGPDRVLAHPNLAAGGFPGLSPDKPLPTLFEVGDPVVGALPGARPAPRMTTEVVDIYRVSLGDREYVLLVEELDGYGPEPLLLTLHVPVDEVNFALAELVAAGLICLAVLIVAVLVGIVQGRLIARPVKRVASQAVRVGALEFDQVDPLPGSRVTELNEQSLAFNRMLAGLVWLETYVPRSLVRRLLSMGQGEGVRSAERELTVLFTDIGGFTPIAEAMPAADVADLLNRHFALLGACIEAEEGTIDKFIGDSLMAFWGAPETQLDHTARACRAALAMARAMNDENRRRADGGLPPLRVRIGIHTGTMVVGNIGAPERMNYTVVGAPVNICRRLEQLGKEHEFDNSPVTIFISEATAEQLPPDLPVTPLGEYQLRGRREPITVYTLRSEQSDAGADVAVGEREDR